MYVYTYVGVHTVLCELGVCMLWHVWRSEGFSSVSPPLPPYFGTGSLCYFPSEHTRVAGHGASGVSPVSSSLEVFKWVLGQSGAHSLAGEHPIRAPFLQNPRAPL